jgi:predicted MFS family arabinose efflux permease
MVKLGPAWCFGLNGLSFLAVIASLLAIRPAFSPQKTSESVLESMRTGVNFLRQREGMVPLVALAFLITFLSYPLITFLPVIARDVFHGTERTFTVFLCLSGAGSIAGALLVAASRRLGTARNALLVMVLLGGFISGIGLSHQLWLTSLLILIAGMLLMVVFAVNSSLVQSHVSDAMRGRVMSVYNVAFRGGMPLGSLISGLLIKKTSAPVIMTANGLLVAFCALYFLVLTNAAARKEVMAGD